MTIIKYNKKYNEESSKIENKREFGIRNVN